MTNKFFCVVYENGTLWIDGIRKRPGEKRDSFVQVIEEKVGKDVNTHGLFEIDNDGAKFHPTEAGY